MPDATSRAQAAPEVVEALVQIARVLQATPALRDTCPDLYGAICDALDQTFAMRMEREGTDSID